MTQADVLLVEAIRRDAAPVVAALHRLTGNFDVAEEAVQDAVVAALETWRRDGVPPNPGGWLYVTARRRAIDRLRRSVREGAAARRLSAGAAEEWVPPSGSADERVPMLFGCCHPALAVEARLALSLRAVAGLTTGQIASAFLVPEATLAQRIVRAKRKIVANRIRMAVPAGNLRERLDDVLTVVYLTYNAGFLEPPPGPLPEPPPEPLPGPHPELPPAPPSRATGSAGEPVAAGLAGEACRLAELVTKRLPGEPEAWGLLALLTLQQSRAAARFTPGGDLVLLADQDRRRWDHVGIARADRMLERAAVLRRPGRYQLQAAIAACHAGSPTWAETDWLQILTLYDVLLRYDASPVVRLNRAVALAEFGDLAAATSEVEALREQLSGYHLWHATWATLLRRQGRSGEAANADRRALELAANPVEQNLLRARLGPDSAAGASPPGVDRHADGHHGNRGSTSSASASYQARS